jgi:hypothetical protein
MERQVLGRVPQDGERREPPWEDDHGNPGETRGRACPSRCPEMAAMAPAVELVQTLKPARLLKAQLESHSQDIGPRPTQTRAFVTRVLPIQQRASRTARSDLLERRRALGPPPGEARLFARLLCRTLTVLTVRQPIDESVHPFSTLGRVAVPDS